MSVAADVNLNGFCGRSGGFQLSRPAVTLRSHGDKPKSLSQRFMNAEQVPDRQITSIAFPPITRAARALHRGHVCGARNIGRKDKIVGLLTHPARASSR